MKNSVHFDIGHWPDLWQAVLRLLEQTVVPNQLQAWIHPLEFIESEGIGNGLRIKMLSPNDFSAQWVRDHYLKAIEAALTQIVGSPCDLVLKVAEASESETQPLSPLDIQEGQSNFQTIQILGGIAQDSLSGSKAPYDKPDVRYTFENFVVGASNQFAYASAVAVAEQPARQYNPLFLYSPPGLGKTHLLHAIGNRLMVQHPKARVAYLSAEKFVNELIDSLQHRRMSQFRAKYREGFDMILIDDIQFIAGKNTSEEEFFHTFNALHSSKRQIVVTSDRLPKEIEGLEERVRTRFEWGLIADISPPEIETRIAILKTKAERDDIYLPDDVATFLASYIKSNVRELEGILIRLQAQASLSGAEISLEMAKHELKTAITEEGSQFTIESIQGAVAKHYHLKLADLKSTSRIRSVALPRQIAMYLIRKYTGIGFKEIGLYFGGKDHTTILHACSKIEAGMEGDPEIRDAVEVIQNLL
ncbi:MAG: chromosomal replication initiator protein DnaA [Bdellovibrio sp.]|nr:chromosomal replication initiator protein DnaA [Bdellovibrio sp.]